MRIYFLIISNTPLGEMLSLHFLINYAMPHKFLLDYDLFTFLLKYKRAIIYMSLLMLVVFGHYFFMRISFESFRYIRQSVMSMLCLLCLSGALMLILQKKGGNADKLFVFLMVMVGLTNLLSLIKGLTTGYAGVVEYQFMSFPMLIYGSVYAYIFLLYPLEAFRPGWLTPRRGMILFLPTAIILVLYLFQVKILNATIPVLNDWNSLMLGSWNFNILLRLLILIYPILGLVIMLRYRKNYVEWCENNYASMEHIDIKWLGDYIFGNLMITVSCQVVVFSNNVRSVLMHNIIFLCFFLYGFYRVLFQWNPYPEGYFKAGMNEKSAQIREVMDTDGRYQLEDCEMEPNFISEKESNSKFPFADKLPEYKDKLEQWMQTEKPHLRKDFKLTDAMEILPLNRSYLSRLFNEGYGENFYRFVMRYRMTESKRLLLSRPDLTITNVADLSGFSSPSVFGRAFTQEMNCSPLQWRERETCTKKQDA